MTSSPFKCRFFTVFRGKIDSLKNGSNDFHETSLGSPSKLGPTFDDVIDPTKTHYDVIIGGRKWDYFEPQVRHDRTIPEMKAISKEISNLALLFDYDVIT